MNLSKWAWGILGIAVIVKIIELVMFSGIQLEERFHASLFNVGYLILFGIASFIWSREGKRYKQQKKIAESAPPPDVIEFVRKELSAGQSSTSIGDPIKPSSNGYLYIRIAAAISLLFLIPSFLDYQTGKANIETNKKLLTEGIDLAQKNENYAAIEKWKQILATEKHPQIISPVYVLIGSAYYIEGEEEEAYNNCTEAVLINPNIVNETQAFSACKEALKIKPEIALEKTETETPNKSPVTPNEEKKVQVTPPPSVPVAPKATPAQEKPAGFTAYSNSGVSIYYPPSWKLTVHTDDAVRLFISFKSPAGSEGYGVVFLDYQKKKSLPLEQILSFEKQSLEGSGKTITLTEKTILSHKEAYKLTATGTGANGEPYSHLEYVLPNAIISLASKTKLYEDLLPTANQIINSLEIK